MNVICFLIIIACLYLFFYSFEILFIIYALIQNLFTFEVFIKFLLLIGSFFTFFFSLIIRFFNKNKTKDLRKVTTKISITYFITTLIIVIFLNLAFLFGIWMDVANIGFSSDFELDFYFVIVQGSIGLYTGNLIGDLFDFLGELQLDDLNS